MIYPTTEVPMDSCWLRFLILNSFLQFGEVDFSQRALLPAVKVSSMEVSTRQPLQHSI